MKQRNDLAEKVIELARHSPSSHNTQPWCVSVSDNVLIISYSNERKRPVGDPTNRELIMSIGCFIESIVIAADSLGYSAKIKYLAPTKGSTKLAEIALQKNGRGTSNGLAKYLSTRRSDRSLYKEKALTADQVRKLSSITIDNAAIKLFMEKNDINTLSTLTHEATLNIMSSQDFRDELSSWVRNNWTKQYDGMPGYTQGMPGPISLLAKIVIRKNKAVAKDQAKKDSKRVVNSAAIGIITTGKNNTLDWINAGRLYQRFCLTAAEMGIKTSAVSSAVIYSATANQIEKMLTKGKNPVALLRIGFSEKSPKAAPRRPVSDIVTTS